MAGKWGEAKEHLLPVSGLAPGPLTFPPLRKAHAWCPELTHFWAAVPFALSSFPNKKHETHIVSSCSSLACPCRSQLLLCPLRSRALSLFPSNVLGSRRCLNTLTRLTQQVTGAAPAGAFFTWEDSAFTCCTEKSRSSAHDPGTLLALTPSWGHPAGKTGCKLIIYFSSVSDPCLWPAEQSKSEASKGDLEHPRTNRATRQFSQQRRLLWPQRRPSEPLVNFRAPNGSRSFELGPCLLPSTCASQDLTGMLRFLRITEYVGGERSPARQLEEGLSCTLQSETV